MNELLRSRRPTPLRTNFPARVNPLFFALLALAALIVSPLSAQTTIVVLNASFEDPTPTSLPGYTIGATNWTRTRLDINSGTFAPGLATPPNPTPAPIDGSQVGYADGFGGLQQVFTDTFLPGQFYTFSVYIGYRSDALASVPQGTGAISLGYFSSGTFTQLASQSTIVTRGNFNFVTGTYQATGSALGQPIALQLTNLDSYQVLYDQAQLSYSAIPEPSTYAAILGAVAFGLAWFRRRARHRLSVVADTRSLPGLP